MPFLLTEDAEFYIGVCDSHISETSFHVIRTDSTDFKKFPEHREFISWKSRIGNPAVPQPQDGSAKSPSGS